MLSRGVANDSQGFDGSNIRVATIYDAIGRVNQTSRPYFTSGGTPKYTTYTNDALGRVIQTVAPDASVTSYVFNGLVTSVTNTLGQTKTTTMNAQGLNASVEDAAGKTTSYVYDAFGDLLTVTDPAGNVVSSSYDIRGNRYQSVDPDMGTWSYVHDVAGQLTGQTDAKSQATSLTYDLLGRPLSRSESGLFSAWTYGTSLSNHNIGQVIDAKACTTSGCSTLVSDRSFNFDSLGRPVGSVLQTASNYYGYQINYDPINGHADTVTYPSGLTVGYSYNAYGFICVVAENNGGYGCTSSGTSHVLETVNTRDAEGHLTQSTAGNGVVTNQTFDANTGLPLTLRAGTSGTVASFDYTFDAIGNLTARTDHNENYTEGFCYDNLNRLTNYAVGAIGTSDWGSNWGAFVWGAPCGLSSTSNWGSVNWGGFVWGAACTVSSCKTVSYDSGGIGNITSKSDVGTSSYPSAGSSLPHAVSSITGVVDGLTNPIYSYDGNGNMTCVSTGASCTGTVGRQVALTAFNLAATITNGSTSIAFTYDSEHQRIAQAATVSGTTTTTAYLNDSASGASSEEVIVGGGAPSWTDYVTMDGQIVAQRTATFGTPTWGSVNWGSFVWGANLSGSNWGAHNWGGFNWGSATSTTWEYFILDHLSSVAVIADASGSVVQRLSYDAWGRQRNPDGTDASCGAITSSTTRGFTNQEQIPAGCLVNLNARIYDPTIGKFMAADPTVPDPFDGQSFNRYAYVINNPLSLTDQTGLSWLSDFFGSLKGFLDSFSSLGVFGDYGDFPEVFVSYGNPPPISSQSAAPSCAANECVIVTQSAAPGCLASVSECIDVPGIRPGNGSGGFGNLGPDPSISTGPDYGPGGGGGIPTKDTTAANLPDAGSAPGASTAPANSTNVPNNPPQQPVASGIPTEKVVVTGKNQQKQAQAAPQLIPFTIFPASDVSFSFPTGTNQKACPVATRNEAVAEGFDSASDFFAGTGFGLLGIGGVSLLVPGAEEVAPEAGTAALGSFKLSGGLALTAAGVRAVGGGGAYFGVNRVVDALMDKYIPGKGTTAAAIRQFAGNKIEDKIKSALGLACGN